MAWLEITIKTTPDRIDETAQKLTAAGFSDLVLEDQAEFENFLEENRACWDYIDETLQAHLQGLSDIRLYLEDTDEAGLARLRELTEDWGLPMTAAPWRTPTGPKAGRTTIPPWRSENPWWCFPAGWRRPTPADGSR